MCGISGIFLSGSSDSRDLWMGYAHNMADSLEHRGPDARGIWEDQDSRVFLSHSRLSVVDLSVAGQQPMMSRDERWVISYNGEVYNCDELIEKLGKNSDTLRGHSDTEVLLETIALLGVEKTLTLVSGMFAFAVWDRKKKELWIARDRFGEKPLYYGKSGKSFAFASELKAFKTIPNFISEIDRLSLNNYFLTSHIQAPKTIYSNIYKLEPGSFLKISNPEIIGKSKSYWSAIDAALETKPFDENQFSMHEFIELFDSVVSSRMVSDVPLGAFLSGGVDSSAVVASMQRVSTKPVKTFTIGFTEQAYDESAYASEVAKIFGTDHTDLILTPEETIEIIPSLVKIYDEPFADSSQIPTLLVSQLAKKDVTVALSGDGGDELFGGYDRYKMIARLASMQKVLPKKVLSLSGSLLQSLNVERLNKISSLLYKNSSDNNGGQRFGHRVHKAARSISASDFLEAYFQLITIASGRSKLVLGAAERKKYKAYKGGLFSSDQFKSIEALDAYEKAMLIDTVTYLPNDLLTKVDRASMSVSLEVRTPFLDTSLYDFAWGVNKSSFLPKGINKWLLKESLNGLMPEKLIHRPKMGFGVPIGSWLKDQLKPWASDLLDPKTIRRYGYLDPDEVTKKWNLHLSGKEDFSEQIWSILMFQSWLEDGN